MKTTIIFVISMLLAAVTIGQNKNAEEKEIIPPQFRYYGAESFNDFLEKNLVFPETEKNYFSQGTVVVEFTVNPDSKISNVKFIQGVSPKINSEVLRVLMASSGKWNPGYVNKVATPLETEAAILFYIDSVEGVVQQTRKHQQKGHEWMFEKNNPKKALKHYDRAIALMPYEECLWTDRALCKHEMGDIEGENQDLERLAVLEERNSRQTEIKPLVIMTN